MNGRGLSKKWPVHQQCACVCVYSQSDRCWTAIVLDFNANWAALPTGGWHGVLVGLNCNMWEAWIGWQCSAVASKLRREGHFCQKVDHV